jgi:hypothetical protein
MPMPPMIRPILPQINRIILMPVKPGLQIPPGFIPPYLVNRIPPNTIPAVILRILERIKLLYDNFLFF